MNKETENKSLIIEVQKNFELYGIIKNVFGFSFATGLPCGELTNFISEVNKDTEVTHLQATNEREAVGISAGAWLAGKKPVLYMQNSGFFEASNDIGSILIAVKIPVLFVVSWRGAPGETATQHFATGSATVALIESFGLPFTIWPDISSLRPLMEEMYTLNLPGVILVKKGKLNVPEGKPDLNQIPERAKSEIFCEESKNLEMTRDGVLDKLFSSLISSKDAVISSTGLISRSIYQNHDSENQFYNAGGFGLTSLIGLGFAINRPNTRTVVIEGDGSVLTNLGALNVISHANPDNFLHVVLNNEAYASCSGESTYGSDKIPDLAKIFEYKKIYNIFSNDFLDKTIEKAKCFSGLQMLNININSQGIRNFSRPLNMPGLAIRFKNRFK